MTSTWAEVVPVVEIDSSADFVTGLNSVDEWFTNNARDEHVAGRVRTHCCLSDEHGLVAFFALRMITLTLTGASSSMQRLADSDGSAAALLLAQMGVRVDLQRNGYGKHALLEALRAAAEIHHQAGFRVLVVDAENDDLITFYEKFGFRRVSSDRRMIMKMSAVHKLLEANELA